MPGLLLSTRRTASIQMRRFTFLWRALMQATGMVELVPIVSTLTVYRGSGGTENSASTGQHDSSASSMRLSTSTTPSSTDNRSDRNVQAAFKDIPVPPPASARPGFLRNSARTFSLGVGLKSSKEPQYSSPSVSPGPAIHPANSNRPRERAMTASTASTATPPKLWDSDLALDDSELDGFGNMFDGIGLRSSRDMSPATRSPQHVSFSHYTDRCPSIVKLTSIQALSSSPPTAYPPTSFAGTAPLRSTRAAVPNPIHTDRNDAIESSPYSWTSQDSRDRLVRSPSPSKTITQNSPPTRYGAPNAATQRKPLPLPKYDSSYEDTLSQLPTTLASGPENTLVKVISHQSDSSIDHALAESLDLANRYQTAKPNTIKPMPNKKVMTPAQFEKYKQQQEMDRRLGLSGDSDSEDEADNYEDDDEVEKEKEAAKQRRKQEAHLAVYRQQMRKVTGEQAPQRSTSSLGKSLDPKLSASTTDLNSRLSHLTVSTKLSSRSSGEEEVDEDEDVPLGILAAHGFPNKSRPPNQLAGSSSNPNLRGLAQQQPGALSVAGGESSKRGSLPVFARQLPQDPYYGASLVNQSNRESLAMHNSALAPMAGSVAATAHPHHPSGLVGVIAGEEKARAMRRGSPNTQGHYDLPPNMQHPGMPRSQTMGSMGQMPYPGMMSPGDHAQMQMSQQMNQMMQMQMHWMQQMQQMMGGQTSPGQQMPPMMSNGSSPNLLAPPGGATRPQSVSPLQGQRSMSTLSPSMANWNVPPQGNYAASIAPSERSNVGLASRYRPVSIAPDPEPMSSHRASTFTSSTRPFSHFDPSPRTSSYMNKPSANPVGRRSPLANDEDDDEQGWAEMKAKKDKKQRTWKLRKEHNSLQELYNGVHSGDGF